MFIRTCVAISTPILFGLVAMILGSACAPWALWRGWKDVQFETNQPTKLITRMVTDSTGDEGVTLVKASINGRVDGWFVLDTGATVAVLDDEVGRTAGLSHKGSIGIGCGLQAEVQKGTLFQLGQFRARDPVFLVLDLDSFVKDIETDVKIAGFIGHAVFQHAVITINYNDGGDQVHLEDPSTFEPTPDSWHAIRILDNGPVVDGRVAGGGRGLFFLDTGKSGTVSLSVPYIKQYNLLAGRKLKRVKNRRLCGTSEEFQGTLNWLTFAGHRIENPTVHFRIPGTEGGDADRVADAVVGRELLKRFDVTFDYPNRRIQLIPNESNLK